MYIFALQVNIFFSYTTLLFIKLTRTFSCTAPINVSDGNMNYGDALKDPKIELASKTVRLLRPHA